MQIDLWDAAFNLAKTIPGFVTYRQSPLHTVMPADLPALGVFILRERDQLAGDSDAGEPHFLCLTTLGFSGIIEGSNADTQLRSLAYQMQALKNLLLSTPSFLTLFRGVEGTDCRMVFSKSGQLPLVEYQFELLCSTDTTYPPIVPDLFKQLHVTTILTDNGVVPEPGDDPPPVIRQYMIEQN